METYLEDEMIIKEINPVIISLYFTLDTEKAIFNWKYRSAQEKSVKWNVAAK